MRYTPLFLLVISLTAWPHQAQSATPQSNRVMTILMTLSNPHADKTTVRTLVRDSIMWVAPSHEPRVLIVRDDGHHGEFADDAYHVQTIMREAGIQSKLIEEPSRGLTQADVQGYNVIWFSNPGYAIDDRASAELMWTLSTSGAAGIILQGDDIAQSAGGFSLEPLTGLTFIDNGTRSCGMVTDNNAGSRMEVTFGFNHPATAHLKGMRLWYGDDIDVTQPSDAGHTYVLAWAKGEGRAGSCGTRRPTVIAHQTHPRIL